MSVFIENALNIVTIINLSVATIIAIREHNKKNSETSKKS